MRVKVVRFAAFAALSLALTYWIAQNITGTDRGPTYQLVATFDDVAGMHDGDDVRLAGITVGEVTAIDVVDGKARVEFAVGDEVPLPTDTVVAVRWRNLIGQRFVGLEPGTAPDLLADGDEVTAIKNVVDLGELVNQLVPLTRSVSPERVNEILTALLTAFDGNDDAFDDLVADFNQLLGVLAERDDTLGQLVADFDTITAAVASRDTQIAQMVDNLVALSSTFADNEDILDAALVEFSDLSSSLRTILDRSADDLGATLEHMAVLTGTAADRVDLLEASLQRLPTVFETALPAVNRGEWLRVSVLCFTLQPGPCPYPTGSSGGPDDGPLVFDPGGVLGGLLDGLGLNPQAGG